MPLEANCIYCSCACNKSLSAIDWGNNNLICYSACNAIHLYTYEENAGGVHFQTLIGHKALVTSVHWIKNSVNLLEDELITTSADHTAAVWKLNGSEFCQTSSLVGHTNVVRNAAAIYLPEEKCNDLLIATLSSDSAVKIWNRSALCTQTLPLGNGFGLDVKLATLSDTNDVIMIMGADDSKIHIFIQDQEGLFISAVDLIGHEDWVQSVDIIPYQNSLMIASASQDNYIRIWKVCSKSAELYSETTATDLKVDETTFSTRGGFTFSVSLESVLSGHENWIYSVRWKKVESSNGGFSLKLLSASMDKTIIIWEPDLNSKIWLEMVRFGNVGGNTLGFYGSVFSPGGNIIIAHDYQGAIHIWQFNKEKDCWQPGLSFGGHYSVVQDIDWDYDGEFLISCSKDQTTRLHAPYVSETSKNSWYEIARPQVHGYDMVCVTMLGRFKFASAGDEKVLRVFEAPRSFAETLENLSALDTSSYIKSNVAEGASVPSLGLSNKAVFQEDIQRVNLCQEVNSSQHPKDRFPDFYYTPTFLTAPPTEETLLQNTLWPETQKLYGHPYEVFTVASNHSNTLLASACKASRLEHAGIILWCTSTWKQVAQLLFHNLTVTQMEFSPDDEYLLSVSRDRTWALFRHFPEKLPPYQKIANLDKKDGIHSRIIWSCSWSFDSLYFATASRDKKVAVWCKISNSSDLKFSLCLKPLEVEDSASAVSFAPSLSHNNRYILAIGLENGCIILSTWCKVTGWNLLHKLCQNIAHHLNINRLKFSPTVGEAGRKCKNPNVVQLASCGSDNHTKIYNILINSIT